MLVTAALMLAELALADSTLAQDTAHKQVLVLHATRRDAQISAITETELPRVLDAGLDRRLDYYSEFIDLARFPEPDYQSAFTDFLRRKYQGTRFDLVIAMGDAAAGLVTINRSDLFRDVPLVFLANNRSTRGGPNSTGLLLERHFAATLPLIESLQPDVTHVFVVSGAGPSDAVFEKQVRTQFQAAASRLTFTYLSGLATDDLERRLAALPARSAVFYALVTVDGAGNRFHPLEYVDRISAVANAPTYCWVDSAMASGVLGGNMYSQRDVATRVAQLALRVLSGEHADSIPIAVLNLNTDQIDWRQLRRWGIAEARVPAGTVIRFREPGIWDRYKVYLASVVLVLLTQTLLIASLLLQHRRTQRAERELRRRQSELQVSYERIRDLGRRLLNAQEAERARIARDLHDDISQQLSLLAIDLAMLRGSVRAPAKEVIDEASARAQNIIRSVHDLSHRLHPYKLQLIGLVPAMQGLQSAGSQAGIRITFTHDNVPERLPPDLTLCLFRVVQEALQNALKHSHAHNVSVRLIGDTSELRLTVADDGIGFDVDRAWGNGLGLVSIRERIDGVGGTFELHSEPGAGTRLEVHVTFVIEDTNPLSIVDFLEGTSPIV
jgi:signal transduction histidine kinase